MLEYDYGNRIHTKHVLKASGNYFSPHFCQYSLFTFYSLVRKTLQLLSTLKVRFLLDCFKEIPRNSTAAILWVENVPDHMFDTTVPAW